MNRAEGSSATSKDVSMFEHGPEHLLVLIHGILAGTSDWTYAKTELKRRLGENYLIYASSSNSYTKTFDGIDGAGKRLADEVLSVIQKTQSLKKISFLAHSLGGLFARYAIALLYSSGTLKSINLEGTNNGNPKESAVGTIRGLEPINFITLATPHLGVRGRKHIFLATFRNRIVYANVSYDHMVGWQSSSIKREAELSKPCLRSLKGYKHVVDVEYCPPVSAESPHFPLEATKGKEAAQTASNSQNIAGYYKSMEEEMIRGLQMVGWKKVDVSFHSAIWPFFAHNNIHVKNEWLHNAGAGVIAHVADSLKQQDTRVFIDSNL